MINVELLCRKAREASRSLALAPTEEKDRVLLGLADWILNHQDNIIRANQLDINAGQLSGLSPAMIDRLSLTEDRIRGAVNDLKDVVELSDPVGEVFEQKTMDNGLVLRKQRVPLGVLAVIYESRPNVTVDVASLAIKSGNAIVLRGGKETIHSNKILVEGIHFALNEAGMSTDIVQFISETNREHVDTLLKMYEYVDMLIPRGGMGLQKYCREHSLIPVITGGIGVCHLFVDESADLDRSVDVIRNAKIQRPTVCNALDTVLVHQDVAFELIGHLIRCLSKDGVSFRLDKRAMTYLPEISDVEIQLADDADFDNEWLSLVLGVKVVDGLDETLQHIIQHSTGHSDGILTENQKNAARFTAEVDSAAVYVNASTRFTDGSQFGLGAEVAVSTQRLHARGPMALQELTTYKWVVSGDYHIRK